MVVLLEGSPTSTEELWSSARVTNGFLVTSLPKALLPRLLKGRRRPALRKSPGDSKLLPFKNGGHCVLEDLHCFGQFLRPHGLVFALTCTVNCGTLHSLCAFPNRVQSIEFTTNGLQLSCRNLKYDQWKQDAPELNFQSHSKESEYLCK